MKQARIWGDKRYVSLNYYLKQQYGEKIYRLSLNGGMSCPNRDGTLGTDGCIFCSAGGSGDFAASPLLSITEQIEQAKLRICAKTNCRKFIAYFQAYTNTYAPVSYLRKIFTEAICHPDIVILSIATRPDCLPPETVSLLAELNRIKPVWVELGLQTIHDAARDFVKSGFSYGVFEDAVYRLKDAGLDIIVHLILGLPNETASMMLASVKKTVSLPIQGIKLQLLHILSGTKLAKYYKLHPFPLFSLESYCDIISMCISYIPQDIVIHRITGDGPKNILLAPLWSADKKHVLNQLHKTMAERNIWQGCMYQIPHTDTKDSDP